MNKKIIFLCLISLLLFSSVSLAAYTSNYAEPSISLRKGTYGTGVKWLQDMLNKNGYSLTVDGAFGNATYNAVISFQKNKNLSVDGIVGPATRKALKHGNTTTNSNSLPTFNRGNTNLLSIIKNCKAYYANNNFTYSTANGVRSIPADKSKSYSGKHYVDCSSFVTWSLYEYALANGKTSMQNYFSYQRNSATFAQIGANGGNAYLKVVSKKSGNTPVNLSLAKPGDILVSNGHVEFFSSYTNPSGNYVNIKVYNCGSNNSVKKTGLTTSATLNKTNITYILRVK